MTIQLKLNEKWIKASILGTVWASSEIVLGSFLHNLKIPFSGNILTAIALVILISASYKWKEKGLFWRSGVICALLKTMSPSAVIFGPMVAIIAEALLLEFSVRLFGRTIFGFILGSVMAMSWVLFQKIANFIIFYGYNIVELYEGSMRYVEKQFSLQFDTVWMPIILLLTIYALFGFFSAIIGIRTGRQLIDKKYFDPGLNSSPTTKFSKMKPHEDFNYSLVWLVLNILFIVAVLVSKNYISFSYWATTVVAIVTIWAFRYKRALRQLVRPKFWIFFVVITMLTAFIFTKIQSSSNTVMDSVLIGLEMNFRAIILIMGFSVLGNELYNPVIRAFFMKSYFKQLPLAMELSLESLPAMLASFPEFRTIVKNPVAVIYQLLSNADNRLNEIRGHEPSKHKVYFLTGGIGEGKTKVVEIIIAKFRERNIMASGIYAPRILENEDTIGYDVVDILTNNRKPFLRTGKHNSIHKIGKYNILPGGMELGITALKQAHIEKADVIIIDEVGKLELGDKGWAEAVGPLLKQSGSSIILTVRKDFVDEVIKKWSIEPLAVSAVSDLDIDLFCDLIINEMNS